MSEIKGKEFPLAKIFSSEFDYEMPKFQRPYAWTEEEAGELFDDLFDFWKDNSGSDSQYFLGSIVLVKDENNPHSRVIDGQQRLTTLTILFAVLSLHAPAGVNFGKYINEPGDELEGRLPKPRLTLRNKDNKFFRDYVQNMKIDELLSLSPETQDTEAKAHIIRNAKLFDKRIRDNLKDSASIKEFGQFLVQRCCIVAVSTSNDNSAFRIFSVMNSRGMDLLITDILKSDIIGKIPEEEQEDYTRIWEDTENNLGREGFSNLFNAIRMIYIRTKAKASIAEEFKKLIIPKIAGDSAKEFIENFLVPYAEAYSYVRDGRNSEALSWLNLIDNSDWIPSAMEFYAKNKGKDEALEIFFRKLERLAACMFALSYDVNKRIERYGKILAEIGRGHSSNAGRNIELTEGEKKAFLEVLDSDIYLLTKKRKYFVLRLDSFLAAGGARYDGRRFSLEHVLPQIVKPDSKWAITWPDEKIREKWVHRIGNLIPLERSLNSSAGNYDFSRKKDSYFFKKGPTSYLLANEIRSLAEWTPTVVCERQTRLLAIFASKYELNPLLLN